MACVGCCHACPCLSVRACPLKNSHLVSYHPDKLTMVLTRAGLVLLVIDARLAAHLSVLRPRAQAAWAHRPGTYSYSHLLPSTFSYFLIISACFSGLTFPLS